MVAFYLDEDTPEVLARLLALDGHSATTTTQTNRKGTKDYEQLWFAALQGWVFLTLNRKDYMLLHGAWQQWDVARSHAGIIVLHHLTEAELTPIAAEISDLVQRPREFFAMQTLAGVTQSPAVNTITNGLFRRRRSGEWDHLP